MKGSIETAESATQPRPHINEISPKNTPTANTFTMAEDPKAIAVGEQTQGFLGTASDHGSDPPPCHQHPTKL